MADERAQPLHILQIKASLLRKQTESQVSVAWPM